MVVCAVSPGTMLLQARLVYSMRNGSMLVRSWLTSVWPEPSWLCTAAISFWTPSDWALSEVAMPSYWVQLSLATQSLVYWLSIA